MRYLITLIFSLLFFSVAFSFSSQDSTLTGNNGQQVKEQVRAQESGNNNRNLMQQKRKGNDVFIDKDGDGICDQRVRGMGFKRGQKGHRQSGKGQGNGQGNGNGSGSGKEPGGNGGGNGNH